MLQLSLKTTVFFYIIVFTRKIKTPTKLKYFIALILTIFKWLEELILLRGLTVRNQLVVMVFTEYSSQYNTR